MTLECGRMGPMPHVQSQSGLEGSESVVRALRGARLWDGFADRASPEPRRVSVEAGRIAAVETDAQAPAADSAGEVDLTGLFLMPGLIDAHVHLGLDPTLKTPDEQLAVPEADRRLRMLARARAMVEAGITTARDLGGGDFMELELRDGVDAGRVVGPRIVCAGQPLTRPDGHCHFWGGGATSTEEQRTVVARQIDRGVDWIKVMATGGVFTKGSSVRDAQFAESEIAAVCAQAADAGLGVAAHCHGTVGIRNAARGGVTTIEHCSFAGEQGFGSDFDADVVGDIARAGAAVSPTMNLGWGHRLTDAHGRASDFFTRMSRAMHALRESCVPLVASTDAGIPGVAHHRLAEGLLAFQRYAALTPVELLRTATSGSAAALGLGSETGRVAPGLAADLVALRRDPTVDPTALLEPVFVVARGRVVCDRRSEASA